MKDNYFSLDIQQIIDASTTDENVSDADSTLSNASVNSELFSFISKTSQADSVEHSEANKIDDCASIGMSDFFLNKSENLSYKELLDTKNQADADKNKLEAEKMRLELERIKLEQYCKEYEQIQEQLLQTSNASVTAGLDGTNEFQENVNDVIDRAISEYNHEKNGSDFEKYMQDTLLNAGYSALLTQESDSRDSLQKSLVTRANNLFSQILIQSSLVNNIIDNISVLQANYDESVNKVSELRANAIVQYSGTEKTEKLPVLSQDLRVKQEGLSAKELLAKIDERELELIKEYNLDITKCIATRGMDGKFHIYEKLDCDDGYFWGEYGNIARRYCYDRGFDICPMGSGEIGNLKDLPELGAENLEGYNNSVNSVDSDYNVVNEVYTFNLINDSLTDGNVAFKLCSYCIASPVSFIFNIEE